MNKMTKYIKMSKKKKIKKFNLSSHNQDLTLREMQYCNKPNNNEKYAEANSYAVV